MQCCRPVTHCWCLPLLLLYPPSSIPTPASSCIHFGTVWVQSLFLKIAPFLLTRSAEQKPSLVNPPKIWKQIQVISVPRYSPMPVAGTPAQSCLHAGCTAQYKADAADTPSFTWSRIGHRTRSRYSSWLGDKCNWSSLTEHYLIIIFFHCTNVLAICLVFVIYLCSQWMIINEKPNSIEYIFNKLCSYGSKNAL